MTKALDMAAAEAGGLISEDVIRKLFKITPVERPCIDSIGDTTAHHYKKEFTDKVLAAPSAVNTMYENQDLTGVADNKYGNRYYNLCQPMKKVVKLSQRGRDVETTYGSDEYFQQVMDAGEELRRDEEAAVVSRNAATPEVADTSGALMAGMATWAIHNTQRGTGAADAVLDGSTNVGGGPTTAPTAGLARPMTETMMRKALRDGWTDGAKFSHIMSTGDMIEIIANYMFTSTARVATAMTNAPQGNRTGAGDGNGAQSGGVVAQGSVNIFVGNFGTVVLTPNRQMTTYQSSDGSPVPVVDVLFFDDRYPQVAYLSGYRSKKLGISGLYDQTVLFVDCCLIPGATHAITTVADIDPALPMVQ